MLTTLLHFFVSTYRFAISQGHRSRCPHMVEIIHPRSDARFIVESRGEEWTQSHEVAQVEVRGNWGARISFSTLENAAWFSNGRFIYA